MKERCNRRINKTIEQDIMAATRKLVDEKRFFGLTLTVVAQEAGVEPGVFYNRYDDLYALLEKVYQVVRLLYRHYSGRGQHSQG